MADMKKLSIIFLILTGIFVSACSTAKPLITLEMDKIDFGEVVNGIVVSQQVRVSNRGDADLEILSVSTSCGCTQASLERTTISPGESAALVIAFDSGAHGAELEGAMLRQVFIASNDPIQPEVVIELTADVVAEKAP
jgi:hypothetical protein